MTAVTQRALPHGYTFLNPGILISEEAEKIAVKLFDKAAKATDTEEGDPHWITDGYCYELLELIDKTLSTIHTKITKKRWDEAWTYLEALTVFMKIESSWPMNDDGERTNITNKVYGASLVTTIRALQRENKLDPEHIPNLDTVLKMAANWGSAISKIGIDRIDYHLVCQGIGKRLFAGKEQELRVLHKARLEDWIKTLKPEEREEVREDLAASEENKDEDEEPWYANKDADEDDQDEDYRLPRVWKKYKAYLAENVSQELVFM